MKKRETYLRILEKIQKFGKGVFPEGKFNFDVSKLGKYANATKALTAVTLVGDLPGVKNLVTKVNDASLDLETKLFNVTLGKIPGVGKLLRNFNDALVEVDKNILEGLNLRKERVNHPKFWTRLGVHNTFNIPSGYTNQSNALNWNNVHNVPSVATINIVDNPVPNCAATRMQLTQLRSLLKAVRGLSNLPYGISDLLAYSINVDALLKIYYKVMKAVTIATKHELSKPNIPKSIIRGLGISDTDLYNNLANYQQALNIMYGYLSKNIAMPNNKWERIKALSMCFLGDNSKLSNSTIYQFSYSGVYEAPSVDEVLTFTSFRKGTLWTLDQFMTTFNNILDNFFIEKMSNITADLIGAFGSSAIFNDKPIYEKEFVISKDLDLLNAIKNSDLQNYHLSGITAKGDEFLFSTYVDTGVLAEDDTTWTPSKIETSNVNTALRVIMTTAASNPITEDTIKLLMPRTASSTTAGFIDLNYNQEKLLSLAANRAVSLDKLKLSEGEALEQLQFASLLESITLGKNTANVPLLSFKITTCYTLVENIEVDYYNGTAYDTVDICSFTDFSDQTALTDHDYVPTLWALVDWLPRINYTRYRSSAPSSPNLPVILWDLAATGLVSLEARKLATYYQTYSQLSIVSEPTTDKYNAKTYQENR